MDGPIFPFVLGFTINTNAWTDAGHAVSQIYDMLYMMGRDDVSVGMGGEGGMVGHILPGAFKNTEMIYPFFWSSCTFMTTSLT